MAIARLNGKTIPDFGPDRLRARGDAKWRWEQCYWCGWWQFWTHANIPCAVGEPLCDWCIDWLIIAGGGPYEPTARTRASRVLQRWFDVPLTAIDTIAEFLVGWAEP
jgi:hypothetical protein